MFGNIRFIVQFMHGVAKSSNNARTFATVNERVFKVSQYCNLDISLPCDISISPLDYHKYASNDQVVLKLLDEGNSVLELVQHEAEGDYLRIFSMLTDISTSTKCLIEAPITADIKAKSEYGNIQVSNFLNSRISLDTIGGNISASKCQSDKISINSSSGDIILSNVLQAAEMCLKTAKSGSIFADRLQGNVLIAATEDGNINTGSSYCLSSTFKTMSGILNLQNTHKNCVVYTGNNGKLNMSGFDGTLHALITDGDATIQITRLDGNSEIKILQEGSLLLKLTEACMQDSFFNIECRELNVFDDVKLLHIDKIANFDNNSNSCSSMVIDSKNSSVNIHKASFFEMFNLKTRL